jgi:hypothetical protein
MSFYFLVYQILVVIVDLIGLTFGILVLRKNFKNPQNQLFFLMTISALGWITFAYLSDLPFLFNYSILLNRIIYFFLSWFFVSAYFFSIYFPKKEKTPRLVDLINKLYLVLGISIAILSLFTPLIIKGVKKTEWGTDLILGSLFPLFYIFGFTWIIPIILLIKKFFYLSDIEKLQMKYFLVGFVIFFLLNIIFNAILPTIRGTYEYYWFGNLSIIFFLGFTGYAIVAHRLFGIEVILTEILVGLIGLLLIVQIFTAQTILWKVINGLIFLLFCVFGYLLIRSAYQEIRKREEAERFKNTSLKLKEKMSEILDLKEIVSQIMETLMETFQTDKISLALKQMTSEFYQFRKTVGFSEKELSSLIRDTNLCSLLEKSQKPSTKEELKEIEYFLEKNEIFLLLPLFLKQKLTGIIFFGEKKSKTPYSKEDIELLETLSYQISTFLNNSLLFEEIKKDKEILEKFYKLTVGRELRMAELKQKIKKLEEKLKERGEKT